MGRYQLRLIGTFALFSPEGGRIAITSKKAIALIALLVTAPNGERSRRWLETMLWGTREPAQAQASLRRELSTLAITLAEAGADGLLSRDMQSVAFAIRLVDVDIFSLGMTMPSKQRGAKGDFLEGLDLRDCEAFEDWLREERARVADMLTLNLAAPQDPLPTARDVLGMALPEAAEILGNAPPRLPPKPSLAVLPFEQLDSGDGGWMGVGFADEIGVILSQFPQLFIVSSSAARALVNQGLAHHDIARSLGVRYLLVGTVTRLKAKLRVSAALVDGQSSEQIWAQTFVGAGDDVFELQKDIASGVAPQIWTMVDSAERRRSLRLAGPANGDYERYWRANALFRSWERGHVAEAMDLTSELVAHNPTCPWASSLAAYCHSIAYLLGYAANRETAFRQAVMHYQTAIRYGDDNVEALGYAAGTLLNIGGDLEIADRLIAHALALLPAHQPTLFWGGWVDVVSGDAGRARERFELALRINPASGVRGQTLCGIGFASLLHGQPDEAYRFLVEACQAGPGFFLSHAGLCVAAVLVGRADVAALAVSRLGMAEQVDFAGLFKQDEHRQLFRMAIAQAQALSLEPPNLAPGPARSLAGGRPTI